MVPQKRIFAVLDILSTIVSAQFFKRCPPHTMHIVPQFVPQHTLRPGSGSVCGFAQNRKRKKTPTAAVLATLSAQSEA